jgi:hypothetical protein
VSTIDGLRVDWPDGFGLIRASNTTPVLVLRFEGHTPEALDRIQARMLALLHSVKPDARSRGRALTEPAFEGAHRQAVVAWRCGACHAGGAGHPRRLPHGAD